ncbi:MAG TPA: MdtA/MuxA family multidrug efflux RND transporter periplasmic adaptor subunit [Bryobacteraceae bacterium]|jgi:multidrug efflux system membrane fusion protein|nr:MdtA/MuxA family multidrug efflux RND transporter periplasmic adaptor subunit [Bryobacteraceae bacterium]
MNPESPVVNEEKQTPPAPPAPPERSGGRSSRLWMWIVLLAIAGAGAYYWHSRIEDKTATAPQSGKGRRAGSGAVRVVGARAQRGDIPVYLNALGAVTPIYTVTVRSRVDGELVQVNYKEGEVVHKGDLLVQIDPRPYQVQLEQAEGQLIHDNALLKNARIDLERYKTLWAQDAIPQQQLATQEATVTQYEGTVKTDQAQIDNAKLQLVYCRITSPIDGRIGLRLVDPGNIVHASDSNGLLVITQIQPISVIFTIPEDNLPVIMQKYRAGARLEVDAFDRSNNTKIAQGTLVTVDNQIDQTTGTVKLRAVFSNADNKLFPSQFVNARVLIERKSGVTLLSYAAIQRNTQSTYVFMVKPDNTVTIRQVTQGVVEDGQTEITSGIAPGDVVVTDGVDKLQEGSKVAVTIAGEKPAAGERPAGSAPHSGGGKRGTRKAS